MSNPQQVAVKAWPHCWEAIDYPECPHCGHSPQNTDHIVLTCPHTAIDRRCAAILECGEEYKDWLVGLRVEVRPNILDKVLIFPFYFTKPLMRIHQSDQPNFRYVISIKLKHRKCHGNFYFESTRNNFHVEALNLSVFGPNNFLFLSISFQEIRQ